MPMFYVPFVVATSDGAASTAFDISVAPLVGAWIEIGSSRSA